MAMVVALYAALNKYM